MGLVELDFTGGPNKDDAILVNCEPPIDQDSARMITPVVRRT